MRLIDADALKDVIERTDWYHLSEAGTMVCGAVSGDNAWYREGDIFKALDEAPTIDAVEVVRCKDCKHGEIDDPDFPDQYYCHAGCGWNKEKFFCSYGERRGDG